MGVIVVGVDGSEGSGHALDFAIKEAAAHGYRLRLVSAWEIPPSVLASVVASREFYDEFRKNAVAVAREAAARVPNWSLRSSMRRWWSKARPAGLSSVTRRMPTSWWSPKGAGYLQRDASGVYQPPGGGARQVPGGGGPSPGQGS